MVMTIVLAVYVFHQMVHVCVLLAGIKHLGYVIFGTIGILNMLRLVIIAIRQCRWWTWFMYHQYYHYHDHNHHQFIFYWSLTNHHGCRIITNIFTSFSMSPLLSSISSLLSPLFASPSWSSWLSSFFYWHLITIFVIILCHHIHHL